jgi:nicotinamide-nucleotide amidase
MSPEDRRLAEMAEDVISRAAKSQLTIVTAESCTAGALASLLASAPGAGSVLHGGFVSYSKEFKIASLGVPAELIASQTAVSSDVAVSMARCALERSPGADIAVAVTGVLGPKSDDDGNPVGLLHVAGVRDDRTVTGQRSGSKDPAVIQYQALQCALQLLDQLVIGGAPPAGSAP